MFCNYRAINIKQLSDCLLGKPYITVLYPDFNRVGRVVFFGENTIFVDVDVQIESGAIIYPNNVVKGESYIGKNVVLESGNCIVDSAICDGVTVCQSYMKNSVVEKKKKIGPFEKLIGVKV